MAMTVVLHRVADYGAWRQVYESVSDLQKSGGVIAESVHRMAGEFDTRFHGVGLRYRRVGLQSMSRLCELRAIAVAMRLHPSNS